MREPLQFPMGVRNPRIRIRRIMSDEQPLLSTSNDGTINLFEAPYPINGVLATVEG